MSLPSSPTVGFIGLGVMGHSMAGHLLDAGYPLVVFTRTASKADALVARGVQWAETPALVGAECDVVVTMVGYPADVEEVYLGAHGLLGSAKAGAYLVDMTTSSPRLAARIAEEAHGFGLHALDAPVSGGDVGARNATLTIMAGGDPEDFEAVLPVLEKMGGNIVLQGPAGAGQHAKMCNQIAIASGMVGVCEALAYAEHAGLDPATVLDSIAAGAAGSWSLSNLAPRILDGDFAPGFFVKHFIKDMRIALDEAREIGLELPGLQLAESLYARLVEKGYADAGTQALYKLYED
jgi:3-hydroxyisobutyrate dehydrogenase